ncbi:hypothetical protein SH580_17055 [Coraliomargarita algicola]|uniref:Uncharacterized protein n=1 Tax=Coraliomargarita algicola TaxID=3092156 RepID=A0ABZ0RK28_9BACT|nr:hypothetical protein [Coraliomargarita sp. J2-16]WPJ95135.1 hypothetical protein SH580_17055 [Coraliomargarita sp. J2-16]
MKQQFESTGKKLRLGNHQSRNLAKRGKAMAEIGRVLQSFMSVAESELNYT